MARDSLPNRAARPPGQTPAGKDVTDQFVPKSGAPLTVSALVGRIKEALLDAFPRSVSVVGQISNFKRHSSGHFYFSLKDANACLDAVMFRADAAGVRFTPEDGLEVVADGRVDVYDKHGRLQLYVQHLTPRGTGVLELAFRQLKERLGAQGLFDEAHKVPLVKFPRGIGVITSPVGAAASDVAATLARRWPAARVYLLPVKVQGAGSAEEIAAALAALDGQARRLGVDTIILCRGGGSLEDLWSFNEEVVARAIYAARTPVVVGVGHETDFTIADFVADVRAATPTAAAELATPDGQALRQRCSVLGGRLVRGVKATVRQARATLGGIARSAFFRDPAAGVRSGRQTVDGLAAQMRQALRDFTRRHEQRLAEARRILGEHHPRRLHEQAAARLGQLRHALAWGLGHRAKLAGDRLGQTEAQLRAAHPRHRLALAAGRVKALERQLESMSYRAVLKRGFSVTRLVGGPILRWARQAAAGDWLESELADGKVRSQVDGLGARPPARRKKLADAGTPNLFGETEGHHGQDQ